MQIRLGGNIFEPNKKKRKPFKLSTKKRVWMKAGGHNPERWRTGFIKTAYCQRCGIKLIWGDRSYDFDHKNNNPANNSEKNCKLICKICHGKVTVLKKRKIRNPITGQVEGHKTIKKKTGYKKVRKKKRKSKRRRKMTEYERMMRPYKINYNTLNI